MPQTPNAGFPYPAASDAPDGAGQIYALAKRLDDLTYTAAFSGSGTVKDWGNGHASRSTRYGFTCTLEFGLDPGANGLSSAANNNGVGVVAAQFKPLSERVFRCAIFNGGWNGHWAEFQLTRAGVVNVNYTTIGMASGFLVSGSVSYIAAA